MLKLTCICLLLTLLCSYSLCDDSFGENVEIFSGSGLDFKWNYWGFKQHLEVNFATNDDNSIKLMNARFNYTEGCFKNAACPETTLLSIAMELSDIRKDLVNVNDSAIVITYDIGNMLNVDPKSLELRFSNLNGNIVLSFEKITYTNFIGILEMNKFLNRNIDTVLFTLIGNRIPSRFNYTLGQSVNVTYSQENHFESDRKDLDLVISRQEMVYSITDVKLLTLADYYKTMCFNNQLYRWIDVIRYDTNVKYVLGNMEMTYTFKGNSDYFENSLQRVNLDGMQMYQSNYLSGEKIDSHKFTVPSFSRFIQGQEIYIFAPIDQYDLTNVDASTDSFTKGRVSKGDIKAFNVKYSAPGLLANFIYQVTSPSSSAIFSISNVVTESDICPKFVFNPTIIQANYASNPDSKLVFPNSKGSTTYFSVIVGCVSDTDCEFSFKISENHALDSKDLKKDFDLVPIIVPNVVVFTFLLFLMIAIVSAVVIIKKKRQQRMQEIGSVNSRLLV